jgi:hypothetical protein
MIDMTDTEWVGSPEDGSCGLALAGSGETIHQRTAEHGAIAHLSGFAVAIIPALQSFRIVQTDVPHRSHIVTVISLRTLNGIQGGAALLH